MRNAGLSLTLVTSLVAGCVTEPDQTAQFDDISAKARDALPEGTSLEDVAKDNDGCYSVFDHGDQWVRPLLDNQGNQICD